MRKYKDAVVLFYDSEFGTQKYFETFEIDMERVLHTPITNVEELKIDIMNQLQDITSEDKVIIIIDSIGTTLHLRKSVDDSLDGKTVADMTRAKGIKSLFRMITPHLTIKDIPLVVVNHTYKEIGMFPKDIVGGGTGSYYSADTIWILGRQQDKDKDGH